jgi:type IV pilus assembly protein PilA
MASRWKSSGFTLIELMIVVSVIALLAAIAIPNLLRFQTRSKQSEAKVNLKLVFVAQRSYFHERETYVTTIVLLGFAPERGNRYAYFLTAAPVSVEDRSTVNAVTSATDGAVLVDLFKYPTAIAAPPVAEGTITWAAGGTIAPPAPAGVSGLCPNCSFLAYAAGNIDNEPVGIDSWVVSSKDATIVPACGDVADTAVPAGQPYNTYNDVNCDT